MSLGILNDLKSVLKLVQILVSQNMDFISYLDRASNSDWKTYLVCSNWNLYAQDMIFEMFKAFNKELIIAAF